MRCIRFKSLVLGLLLSLVALENSIAYAFKGNDDAHVTDDRTKDTREELMKNSVMISNTRDKFLKGRKLGADAMAKEEMGEAKSTMNTGANPNVGKCGHGGKEELNMDCELKGKAMKTSGKPLGSSNSNISEKEASITTTLKIRPPTMQRTGTFSKTKLRKSHDSENYDTSKLNDTKKLLEATREIFNMLSKDYQTRARRRPPINNHLPLVKP